MISRTLAQAMPALRRYARTDTIRIIHMPARLTASTARNGLLAECLSVSVPGITGDGDTADTTVDTMVARDTTDAVITGAAATTAMAMLEDEDMPAGMRVAMRAAATEADIMVAVQFMVALDFTAAVAVDFTAAAVVASTVAVDMAAGTGNPVALES